MAFLIRREEKMRRRNREKRAGCASRQKNGVKRKKCRDRWMDVVTENGEVKEGG